LEVGRLYRDVRTKKQKEGRVQRSRITKGRERERRELDEDERTPERSIRLESPVFLPVDVEPLDRSMTSSNGLAETARTNHETKSKARKSVNRRERMSNERVRSLVRTHLLIPTMMDWKTREEG